MSNKLEWLIATVCLFVGIGLFIPRHSRPTVHDVTNEVARTFWTDALVIDDQGLRNSLIEDCVVIDAAIEEWASLHYGSYIEAIEAGKDPREASKTLVPWINLCRSTERIASLSRTTFR